MDRKEYFKKYYKENKKQKQTYAKKYELEHRELNRERNKEYSKQYRLKHRREILEREHKYYQEKKKQILAKNKRYSKTERGKMFLAAQNKRYRNRHPERIKKHNQSKIGREVSRRHNQKRRAKINQVIHLWTREQYNDKLDSMHGICSSCNEWVGRNKLTLDHIYPISKAEKGRTYSIKDIEFMCKSCNSIKQDKILVII